jgi:hypothetical protein
MGRLIKKMLLPEGIALAEEVAAAAAAVVVLNDQGDTPTSSSGIGGSSSGIGGSSCGIGGSSSGIGGSSSVLMKMKLREGSMKHFEPVLVHNCFGDRDYWHITLIHRDY